MHAEVWRWIAPLSIHVAHTASSPHVVCALRQRDLSIRLSAGIKHPCMHPKMLFWIHLPRNHVQYCDIHAGEHYVPMIAEQWDKDSSDKNCRWGTVKTEVLLKLHDTLLASLIVSCWGKSSSRTWQGGTQQWRGDHSCNERVNSQVANYSLNVDLWRENPCLSVHGQCCQRGWSTFVLGKIHTMVKGNWKLSL